MVQLMVEHVCIAMATQGQSAEVIEWAAKALANSSANGTYVCVLLGYHVLVIAIYVQLPSVILNWLVNVVIYWWGLCLPIPPNPRCGHGDCMHSSNSPPETVSAGVQCVDIVSSKLCCPPYIQVV